MKKTVSLLFILQLVIVSLGSAIAVAEPYQQHNMREMENCLCDSVMVEMQGDNCCTSASLLSVNFARLENLSSTTHYAIIAFSDTSNLVITVALAPPLRPPINNIS